AVLGLPGPVATHHQAFHAPESAPRGRRTRAYPATRNRCRAVAVVGPPPRRPVWTEVRAGCAPATASAHPAHLVSAGRTQTLVLGGGETTDHQCLQDRPHRADRGQA